MKQYKLIIPAQTIIVDEIDISNDYPDMLTSGILEAGMADLEYTIETTDE